MGGMHFRLSCLWSFFVRGFAMFRSKMAERLCCRSEREWRNQDGEDHGNRMLSIDMCISEPRRLGL